MSFEDETAESMRGTGMLTTVACCKKRGRLGVTETYIGISTPTRFCYTEQISNSNPGRNWMHKLCIMTGGELQTRKRYGTKLEEHVRKLRSPTEGGKDIAQAVHYDFLYALVSVVAIGSSKYVSHLLPWYV